MMSHSVTYPARELNQDPDQMIEGESEAILHRAQQGDPQALAMIYDCYHQPLYRYIYRQVGDVEVAHDLTGDLFQRLLEALARANGPDQYLQAWLYRTAHNLVIDYYRRQQHRRHLPLHEELLPADDSPAISAATRLEADRVRRALYLLTETQRQVIVLKFLQGLSNEEVAAIVEKPVGAVKSLQHRGLQALRRHLAPERKKVLP